MKPWLPLRCEDGMAMTVPDDWTDRLGALIELLHAEYGGPFTRDNPVLIRAAENDCRIQTWRSFTKADLEGECVDWDEGDGTYYGQQGSGAKHITVLWCERGAYVLGERAEAAGNDGGSDG